MTIEATAPGRSAGRVVIVGGGLAGYSAAETLRQLGHRDAITIIDSEPTLYDRPPLSKELLEERFSLAALEFATPTKLSELAITVILNNIVTSVDTQALSVTLASGDVLAADTILLATGGRARRLEVPGFDLDSVHVLRTISDAEAIRRDAHPGVRAAVIGAGLIGAELASAFVKVGAHVTLIDPSDIPLKQAVGETAATYLHSMHASNGVHVLNGNVTSIEADSKNDGVCVVLGDNRRVDVDLVVVGIGIVPNVDLAVSAGIEVDDGILVDHQQRTSAPNVFAAGDVARYRSTSVDGLHRRREEHWEAAQLSGHAAAAGILGRPVNPGGASWFWSDRHGIHLEVTGRLVGSGTAVVRESSVHPAFFLIDGGVLVGAASIDDPNIVRAARRLINQRIPVRAEDIADPSFSLRRLLKAEQ